MYEIILRRAPERYLEKGTPKTKRLFKEYFIKLEANPYSIAIPLQGTLKGTHKVSVGNKRMIVLINKIEKMVNILAIGPRGDIYK
ncbi:MAG: hypothetical protein V1919_03015 [Candidatus Omnitrophota bacterium]